MANIPALILTPFPAQDYIVIGADPSPGKATIINLSNPSGWDERKGYGQSGATLVPVGDPLATWDVLFEIWSESDYALYKAYYAKYFSTSLKIPGAALPLALSIAHPVLAHNGLSSCEVVDRSEMMKDEFGLWSQVISFKQYRKPVPAPQKPIAAIPAAQVPVPTAQDANEQEIEKLSAELAALP